MESAKTSESKLSCKHCKKNFNHIQSRWRHEQKCQDKKAINDNIKKEIKLELKNELKNNGKSTTNIKVNGSLNGNLFTPFNISNVDFYYIKKSK